MGMTWPWCFAIEKVIRHRTIQRCIADVQMMLTLHARWRLRMSYRSRHLTLLLGSCYMSDWSDIILLMRALAVCSWNLRLSHAATPPPSTSVRSAPGTLMLSRLSAPTAPPPLSLWLALLRLPSSEQVLAEVANLCLKHHQALGAMAWCRQARDMFRSAVMHTASSSRHTNVANPLAVTGLLSRMGVHMALQQRNILQKGGCEHCSQRACDQCTSLSALLNCCGPHH